jgi:hypothetical protein
MILSKFCPASDQSTKTIRIRGIAVNQSCALRLQCKSILVGFLLKLDYLTQVLHVLCRAFELTHKNFKIFRYDVNRSGTITKDEFTAILEVSFQYSQSHVKITQI